MAKLKVDDIVNKKFVMKSGRELTVINYEFKEKTNHLYKCKFIDTNNEYVFNRTQILKGTARDIIREKQLKTLMNKSKLIERNRLVKKSKEQYSYPYLKNKIVLGIDLATKTTGLCFYRDNIYKTNIIKSNSIDTNKRSYEIVKQIVDIIKKYKVEVVIIENLYLGLNSNVLILLSQIRGMLIYHIEELGIETHLVMPNLWKHHFNLSIGRTESKKEAIDIFEKVFKRKAISDDEADAYLLTRFAVETSKE